MDALARVMFVVAEDQAARRAAERWVRAPAVGELARLCLAPSLDLLEPVEDLLPDQVSLLNFTMGGLALAIMTPDEVVHAPVPPPFDTPAHLTYLAMHGCPLDEQGAAELTVAIQHAWVLYLRFQAHALAEMDVPLDPGPSLTDVQEALIAPWTTGWGHPDAVSVSVNDLLVDRDHNLRWFASSVVASDLFVLAQLLTCEIDWSAPDTIVNKLNLIPPSAVTADGRGVVHRDGRSHDERDRFDQWRAWWRSQQPDDRSALLANKGGRPPGPALERSRLEAVLRETVLPAHPDVTVTKLIDGWRTGRPESGRLLRESMCEPAGAHPPRLRTLQRALAACKTNPSQ